MRTARLHLVAATPRTVAAEQRDDLAAALEVELAEDWPPEFSGPRQQQYLLEKLAEPGTAGWWSYYLVVTDAERPTVIGTAGYKGPPADGVVEIGYSVVASHQRRGYATEACSALIARAWERGADTVLAQTLPDRVASQGVLRKLGFAPAEPIEPGVLAFALRRPAT